MRKAKAAIREVAVARDKNANGDGKYEVRNVEGWSIHIRRELLTNEAAATAKALELIKAQLEEIIRVVPKAAVVELKKVPLYFSPGYPGIRPSAEYHPGADWLSDNGRDPAMAKGVEFTNIRVFEEDTRRMPNFALHELAHAYHDRFLPGSHDNAEIKAAYDAAKAAGSYERVERTDADGSKRMDRAYAITNPAEYFAEATEAYFSRNDFFPYTRDQLKKHDPGMYELLGKLWGTAAKTAPETAKFHTPEQDMAGVTRVAPVDENLPNVLILGDSISIGYTVPARDGLKGKANVIRPRDNCGDTPMGLNGLDGWLGKPRWDVIHFNWGLWDLCYRNPQSKEQGKRDKVNGKLSVTPADYERNLEEIVGRLKATGAKLIWASTTAVPEGETGRFAGDEVEYNAIAARVMQRHGIATNDLHALSKSFAGKHSTKPGDVHYTPEGSALLAAQVVKEIEAALKK